MKFNCPNCKKSGQIDDSKIPDPGIYATCPECYHKFLVKFEAPEDFEFEPVVQSPQEVASTPPPTDPQPANLTQDDPAVFQARSSSPIPSEGEKESFWVGKPMRYLYAAIACFVVLMLSAAIKSLFGLGPIEGGAIPALIITSALIGTWYAITKQDKYWAAYFVGVIVVGFLGVIFISQIKSEAPASPGPWEDVPSPNTPKIIWDKE